MAELLEKLFKWQYFEPALFTSIGVLLLLLFIVLFLGKKDQKKKLEETKKLELSSLTEDNSVDAFAKNDVPEVGLEIPEEKPVVVADEIPEQPAMNMNTTEEELPPIVPDFEIFGESKNEPDSVMETQVNTPNITLDDIPVPEVAIGQDITPVSTEAPEPISIVDDVVKSSVVTESVVETPVKEESNEEKIEEYKNHFADLASSISKELDEINRLQDIASSKEKAKTVGDLPLPDEVSVTPISEATKFTPSSVFSSVYSPNKDKEEQPDEVQLPDLEDNNPYKFDMPIKKEEMELPKVSSEPVNVPDFSSFDNETFDIK